MGVVGAEFVASKFSECASEALACEHRLTFSGHESMLNSLDSNFTADMDNALLFLHRKCAGAQDMDEEIIFVFLLMDVIWLCCEANQLGSEQGIFQCTYI